MSNNRQRFALTLEALPDPEGPAAARRLARGLKYLLRSCRLKCIRCQETADPSTAESAVRAETTKTTGETARRD